MDTKKRNTIYIGLAALGVVIIVWFIFRETPVSVEAAASKRGPMIVTIDGEGKTRVRERYTIGAPAAGHMQRVTLHAGDLDSTVGDIADLTADYDVVVADSPGVLPGWSERGLAVVQLMREPLDIALHTPFGISGGAQAMANNVLVTLELDGGFVGHGEAAPLPPYNGETQAQAMATLAALGESGGKGR